MHIVGPRRDFDAVYSPYFVASPGVVTCFDSQEEDDAFWKNTVAKYINETISGKFNERDLEELYSQVDLAEQKYKDFTGRCQDGPVGPYLKYIGTSSTVRDLVSLGDALVGKGEPIDYYGLSPLTAPYLDSILSIVSLSSNLLVVSFDL